MKQTPFLNITAEALQKELGKNYEVDSFMILQIGDGTRCYTIELTNYSELVVDQLAVCKTSEPLKDAIDVDADDIHKLNDKVISDFRKYDLPEWTKQGFKLKEIITNDWDDADKEYRCIFRLAKRITGMEMLVETACWLRKQPQTV